MNWDLYKNIVKAYNENGPFYISKNPKIKIGESDFHGTSYFVVYIDAGIIKLEQLLKSANIKNHILDKITEWNYTYNLKKDYFSD